MGWRPDSGIFPSSPSDIWPHTLLGLRRFFVGKEITNLSEANSLHTYQTTWTSAKAWNSKIEHPRGTESCFPVFKSVWEQKFLHWGAVCWPQSCLPLNSWSCLCFLPGSSLCLPSDCHAFLHLRHHWDAGEWVPWEPDGGQLSPMLSLTFQPEPAGLKVL